MLLYSVFVDVVIAGTQWLEQNSAAVVVVAVVAAVAVVAVVAGVAVAD